MCSDMCDSMHLGALLKSMKKNGLSMYKVAPYSGLSVESVVDKISGFKAPEEFRCPQSRYSSYMPYRKCSVVGNNVEPAMDRAMVTLQGLFLTS